MTYHIPVLLHTEQLESIKMKSLQLEERRKEMENDKEEFETKKFRDQNTMNAESKRLKRAHSLLIIEQENWEEEVTKEREQVKKMRQTLEVRSGKIRYLPTSTSNVLLQCGRGGSTWVS